MKSPSVTGKGIKKPISNVAKWLGYSVLIALVPIFFSYVIAAATSKPFSLEFSLSHGELLLVSIAVVGEALGDLLVTNAKGTTSIKGWAGFGCTIVIISSCMLFGVVATTQKGLNTTFVMQFSIVLFLVSLIAGGSCKWRES